MTTEKMISFKDFILSKNPYFNDGYAVAFKDTESKQILLRKGTDFLSVMPNDILGNYFYIRYSGVLSFNETFTERVADNQPFHTSYTDRQPIVLVAVMKDADEYTLMNNLRNTCAMFKTFSAIPTGGIIIPEQVVLSEMSGAKNPDIAAALQRVGGFTMVALNINVQDHYQPNKCIVDPCKC